MYFCLQKSVCARARTRVRRELFFKFYSQQEREVLDVYNEPLTTLLTPRVFVLHQNTLHLNCRMCLNVGGARNFHCRKRAPSLSFFKSLKVTTPSESEKPSLTVWAVSMFNSKRLKNGGLIKFNRVDVFPKKTHIRNGSDCKRQLFQTQNQHGYRAMYMK